MCVVHVVQYVVGHTVWHAVHSEVLPMVMTRGTPDAKMFTYNSDLKDLCICSCDFQSQTSCSTKRAAGACAQHHNYPICGPRCLPW